MWQWIKNQYHLLQAISASIRFGMPWRTLTIIGVTGTDGKTTTVNLIYHILRTSGKTCSMVSTVGASIHGISFDLAFHVTNPSSFPLQKFLHEAVTKHKKDDVNYLVLEVTSHGLDQNRVWGLPFEIGVLTNITHEHLDYHKTYDNYLRAKVKLFMHSKKIVLNKDDASYEKVMHYFSGTDKIIATYGMKDADVNPKKFPFTSTLIGEFNKYNILAAVSACKLIGISDTDIRKGIRTFTTPLGRMNEVENNKGIRIFIDYAHTANGIRTALNTLRLLTKKKLITLIGAEGYRDEKKRPFIGEIAVKLADYVIVTAVDPRGLIHEINEQILLGIRKSNGKVGENIFIENDREQAINLAINVLSKKGDTVAILGKGHEKSMNLDGKHELPWSDFEAVNRALKSINKYDKTR